MRKRVATLENHNHDTLPHPSAEAGEAVGAARVECKFQYAGGDRPLAGYKIKRGVGQGGFGEIYYAQNEAGKDVALKLVRRNLEVELRGIRHCLNLKHPHLLDIYDIRQDDRGDTWIVMEYVADRSLADILETNPRGLPTEDSLTWIHGIGAGVAYLHEHGIVHRDLKPANIFRDEGVAKVGDYGLSKFISCSQRSGHTESIGTVHYMAPEIARGRYGKEIDVYAMGVILYELLTGRVPFDGESVGEVLMKHLTAKADVSMLAEPYRGVVAKALEKDPAMRFRSAGEMLTALPAPASGAMVFNNINNRGTEKAGPAAEISTPTVAEAVSPEPASKEPIIRAVRKSVHQLRRSINDAKLETPVKIVIGVLLAIVTIQFWPLLFGWAVVLGVLYCVYRLAWTLFGEVDWMPDEKGGNRTAEKNSAKDRELLAPGYSEKQVFDDSKKVKSSKALRRNGQWPTPVALLRKTRRDRFAELLGSMLGAVAAAAAMCMAAVLVENYQDGSGGVTRPEQFAWLLSAGVIGAWAVMVPAKFWDGASGDALFRRFVMMVVGMGVGAIVFLISEWLYVGLPAGHGIFETPNFNTPRGFYGLDGRPLLMAYAASFGALFAVVRWWRLADPLRPVRLRIWTVVWVAVAAYFVALMLQFPQPWLPITAGVMAVSIQLASPWLHPDKRF